MCSHGSPTRARTHPRPLAAATPASPGSSAKLFTAAISRQGESSAPRASGCSGRDGAEGTGRRPSRSARGTSADLPRDAPSPGLLSGSGWRTRSGLGEAISPAAPIRAPSSHPPCDLSVGTRRCNPHPFHQVHSGLASLSNELTHNHRRLGEETPARPGEKGLSKVLREASPLTTHPPRASGCRSGPAGWSRPRSSSAQT